MPGLSLDRSDHGIRNQILASMNVQKPLFDEKEIKVELCTLFMFNFYQPWWSIGRADMAATGYREFETVNMKTL